jgi:CheY-like chemotaxis protein/HPt (histidine-containing phosphotransfer) domain-containing protein
MSDMQAFQALLLQMRDDFLQQLAERCDRLDELILKLEKDPVDREAFNELFRGVHSLKGSGGTLGLSIITTICHQLENYLTETDAQKGFGSEFATRALAYVDLVRRIEALAQQDNPDFKMIEGDLDTLRQAMLQSRRTGLIAESSGTMSEFYKHALQELPVQLVVENNGLIALERLLHESFDFVIVGREIDGLNGIALMLALRENKSRNKDIPAILVSSTSAGISKDAGFNAILPRDKHLAANLQLALKAVLGNTRLPG